MNKKIIGLLLVYILTACNQATNTAPTSDSAAANPAPDTQAKINVMPPGPVPNTIMTDAYVKSLATSIYLWGWPMVNVHNRVEAFRPLPGPMYAGGIVPVAPPNQLCMLTDYVVPEERAVACPNQDVVYGYGAVDLTKEPVVIQVPDFGDRFWVYQIANQRTDGFASIGKMYGSKSGFYLLAANDWNGKLPDGINAVFKCPTAFGIIIPRVFQTNDPADKKAVQSVVNQISMYPLSQFDGKMKTIEWTKTPATPPDPSAGKSEMKWVKPEVFFDQLPAILNEVPPMPGEEALYAQMKSLTDAVAKDPKVKALAMQAAKDAETNLINPLFQFVNVGYPVRYNWTTQNNGAQFGTDYLTRVACAKSNIFVNKPNETRYFYQDRDSSGMRLTGANKYSVTFAKGQLPPVKGFWSLTMYGQEHFFVPNNLKRYSLGTKNKDLQSNPDGSLTIYVQSTPPGADKMNNWLPSPKEPFSLYVRCYWPEEAVSNDSWTPPAVVKVK